MINAALLLFGSALVYNAFAVLIIASRIKLSYHIGR
jgi:hypothetical protein